MSDLGRDIVLACEHPEGLATLHQAERTAWCPVCEADVEVRHLPDSRSHVHGLASLGPRAARSAHDTEGIEITAAERRSPLDP